MKPTLCFLRDLLFKSGPEQVFYRSKTNTHKEQ